MVLPKTRKTLGIASPLTTLMMLLVNLVESTGLPQEMA